MPGQLPNHNGCVLLQGLLGGNHPVVAINHTVILNWNRETIPLLRQIAICQKERDSGVFQGCDARRYWISNLVNRMIAGSTRRWLVVGTPLRTIFSCCATSPAARGTAALAGFKGFRARHHASSLQSLPLTDEVEKANLAPGGPGQMRHQCLQLFSVTHSRKLAVDSRHTICACTAGG